MPYDFLDQLILFIKIFLHLCIDIKPSYDGALLCIDIKPSLIFKPILCELQIYIYYEPKLWEI